MNELELAIQDLLRRASGQTPTLRPARPRRPGTTARRGEMRFNPRARLDTSQIQDLRSPAAAKTHAMRAKGYV